MVDSMEVWSHEIWFNLVYDNHQTISMGLFKMIEP